MIKLQKVAKPQILIDNEHKWTVIILQKIQNGETLTKAEKTRYRHPQIKVALIQETNGKCAYCESKLLHIHHGDVEHIYPKSLEPGRLLEWQNLTLSCEICNQNKSNKDPVHECIIDPYVTDPSDHLLFSGPLVFPRGTPEGTSTRSILDLNRGELAERRKEILEKLMQVFDTISRYDIPVQARRAIFRDIIERYSTNAEAYTAMARAAIDLMTANLPVEVTQDQ